MVCSTSPDSAPEAPSTSLARVGSATIGESVPEVFHIGLEGERRVLKVLADGIKVSLEQGDDASREFFASTLLEEEEHADWLETQLAAIDRIYADDLLLTGVLGEPTCSKSAVMDEMLFELSEEKAMTADAIEAIVERTIGRSA